MGTDELDEAIAHGALGVPLGIGLNVSKITNVAVLVAGSTVGLAVRVDYSRSAAVRLLGEVDPGGNIQ